MSFWTNRHVFVTGCSGFLGSWLTIYLVDQGAHVVGLVRDTVPTSNLKGLGYDRKIEAVNGSLTDYALLERALNDYEIDSIFHIAAQPIVTVANRNPFDTFESNVRGTYNLLEAARRTPAVKRIVVASTDKAYGDQPVLPYTEESPLLARYPYEVSKACSDLITHSYYHTFGLPVAVTRCGNLYGGGDLNWNRIVPGTIRSALRGEQPLVRSDGGPMRDYIYVKDVVDAYMRIAESLDRPDVQGQAFNISPNRPLRVLELVEQILSACGRPDLQPHVVGKGKLHGEIVDQYLDSTKIEITLGWKPQYSLAEGLRETVAWYREFLEVSN